jgi:hypothetical protein
MGQDITEYRRWSQWKFVPIARLCIIRMERTENEREHEAMPALELCEQSLKSTVVALTRDGIKAITAVSAINML